jgi:hypothetical protein
MQRVRQGTQVFCEVAAVVRWAAADAVCQGMSRGLHTSPRCTGSGCPDLVSAAPSTCRLRACTEACTSSLCNARQIVQHSRHHGGDMYDPNATVSRAP